MSGSAGRDAKAEPNLTPILDMVFQLITFFMLVINFKAAELDLSLQLPVLTSAKPLPPEQRNVKLVVLNVQICTKCPVSGCDAMATLHRVVDDDTKKLKGYRLVCERGHGGHEDTDPIHPISDYPLRSIPNGKTCLSINGWMHCKEARGNDIQGQSIESYLKDEAGLSMMAAGLTRDDIVTKNKELPDIVVIRADSTCRFGAVNYIITKCQEQGYRTFALKTMHTDRTQ